MSEGHASWNFLVLTWFCGYRRSAILPLRARPVPEPFLKLRDSDGRLEWALKEIIIRSGSSGYEGVSRPVLGKATLTDTTPTREQHTGGHLEKPTRLGEDI